MIGIKVTKKNYIKAQKMLFAMGYLWLSADNDNEPIRNNNMRYLIIDYKAYKKRMTYYVGRPHDSKMIRFINKERTRKEIEQALILNELSK